MFLRGVRLMDEGVVRLVGSKLCRLSELSPMAFTICFGPIIYTEGLRFGRELD